MNHREETTMKITKPLALGMVSTALLGLADSARATNGDQMLGITATQWGMGGAVLAAPQDAATIMYNPAGLAELDIREVRFDMGFGVMNPPRKINGYESDSNYYLMPAGAVAFNDDDRVYIGMGMGGLSGMGVDFPDTTPTAGNQAIVTTKQFYKIAPGMAWKVGDRLSIGAAVNIDYQSLALYTPSYALPQNQVYGYGGSLGAIYHFTDRLQIGVSWISKQHMNAFEWNTAGAPTASGKIRMTMDGPEQYGVGLAFKPAAGTLVEFDVKRIKFSDVLGNIDVERPSGYAGPVPSTLAFGWDDQTVYALGIQQNVGAKTAVRVGFNYGKSPIGPEDVDANKGSLAIVEKHASVGVTRQLGTKVFGSLSYAHAFHNEIQSRTSATKIELEQNIVNAQLSYKF
jgi:long-chain fatty acid transport protein